MSAIRVLASELAYARADYADRSGYFALTGDESPAEARDFLLAYYHLVDTSKRVRSEMAIAGAPVREQLLAGCLQQEIEDAIAGIQRYLSRIARRGGRGHAAAGAGRSPASAEGTSMAHGCAALASAVGPASTGSQVDITLSC